MRNLLNKMVAKRFSQLQPYLRKKNGDYIYGRYRTKPENLGWRFRQTYYFRNGGLQHKPSLWLCLKVWLGFEDDLLEKVWHDAASAEHWYRYEKQWD